MKALSGLRLKCAKCGERSASGSGKEIERTLVYTEVELKGLLQGDQELSPWANVNACCGRGR